MSGEGKSGRFDIFLQCLELAVFYQLQQLLRVSLSLFMKVEIQHSTLFHLIIKICIYFVLGFFNLKYYWGMS